MANDLSARLAALAGSLSTSMAGALVGKLRSEAQGSTALGAYALGLAADLIETQGPAAAKAGVSALQAALRGDAGAVAVLSPTMSAAALSELADRLQGAEAEHRAEVDATLVVVGQAIGALAGVAASTALSTMGAVP